MRNVLAVGIVMLFAIQSFAQNHEGVILDSASKAPLQGVHIYYNNQINGVVSDSEGQFSINYEEATLNDSIYFSMLNYNKLSLSVREVLSRKSPILMVEASERLNEVSISSNKKNFKSVPFTEVENLPFGLFDFGSVLVEDKIYVVSGNTSLESHGFARKLSAEEAQNMAEPNNIMKALSQKTFSINHKEYSSDLLIYDIKDNKWTKEDHTNFSRRAMHQAGNYEGKIYSFGGKTLSRNRRYEYLDNTIEIYNIANKEISIDETNPHMAVNAASFIYKNSLVIMGGSVKKDAKTEDKEYTNKIHLQNLKTGLWYDLGNMPESKETQGILVHQKFYMVGGYNGQVLKGIESYDVKTRKWKREALLFEEMAQPALATKNNLLYIYENGKLCTFNVITKELKEYAISINRFSPTMHIYDHQLYIIGGLNDYNHNLTPQNGVFKINLNDIENSEVKRSENFGGIANAN